MQIDETLLFGKEKLRLRRLEIQGNHVGLFATTAASTAQCPICACVLERVHSSYTRTISDLPWHGRPVILRLRIRRFFCDHDGCRRVIFAERIPEVEAFIKAPNSRRTGGWLERDAQKLTGTKRAFVERLKELCPAASEAGRLTRWVRKLVKERCPAQLDEWLNAAERSTLWPN